MTVPFILSQITATAAIIAFLFLTWGPTLPQDPGGLPQINNEAFLIIRDDILKPGTFLSKVSDFYYNHTVTAMLPLRPPLGSKYLDRTVLYFGEREDVGSYFEFEHTLPFIRPGPVDWELIRRGVPVLLDTTKAGPPIAIQQDARTGAQSFELLLVDAAQAGGDFWERLERENPWLVERTAVLDVDKITMAPSMTKTLDKVSALQHGTELKMYDLISRAVLAVQFKHDKHAARRDLKQQGFWLLTHAGLPMLLLWMSNGILSALTLWPRRGMGRGVSVAVALFLGLWIFPSVKEFAFRTHPAKDLAMWNAQRSKLAGIYSRLSDLLDQQSAGESVTDMPRIQGELKEFHQEIFKGCWNAEFFAELEEALHHENGRVRARAMATLQRLLGCIHLMDRRLLSIFKMEHLSDDRSLDAWTAFQHHRLPITVLDPDPVVAYWALLCAPHADRDNKDFIGSVLGVLGHPDLNVRDKAVEALGFHMTPEGMNALAGIVSQRPEGSLPDPCDYVRRDAYAAMLVNRGRFPPSKLLLVPASGE